MDKKIKLLLLFACMLSIVPFFATSFNLTGHPDFQYWDDFSQCTPSNPALSCGWINDSLGYINRKASATLNGKVWLNLSALNMYTYRQNLWTKARGSVVSVQYTVLWRRMSPATKARVDFMFTQDSSGIGANIPKGYMYIYQSNSTPTTFFRIYTGTAEFTTTRFPTYSVNREYTVCMQLTNKTAFDSSMRPSIIINKTYVLTNNHSIDAAQFSSLDSLIFWTDAKNGNGTYITGVKVWYGNCTNEPLPASNVVIEMDYPITNNSHQNSITWNQSIKIRTDKPAKCDINSSTWYRSRTNTTIIHFDNATVQPDRDYFFKINCTSIAAGLKSNKTFNVVIDNTIPIFQISQWHGWGNGSYYNSTFYFSTRYTDTYLWRTNTTVKRGTTFLFSRYNTSITGGIHNITRPMLNNISYTTSTTPYIAYLEATDSHTMIDFAEGKIMDIKETVESLDNKALTHDLDGTTFKIEYPIDVNIEPIRMDDKISYDITTEKPGEKVIYIESPYMEKIEDSEYPCHFVIPKHEGSMEGYWYDCAGLDNPRVTEVVKNEKYQILYEQGLEEKMNSLGGLNYRMITWQFFVDKVAPKFVGRNNISSDSAITLYFNTSEAVNYTYGIGNDCRVQNVTAMTSISAFNNLTKSISRTGLKNNTRYSFNITLFDSAQNKKNFCYNISTAGQSINIQYVSLQLSLIGNNYLLSGSARASSATFPQLHYNWILYRNGTIYRQRSFIHGQIDRNYTQNQIANFFNISGIDTNISGTWMLTAQAYQNSTPTNKITAWKNSSEKVAPFTSNISFYFYNENNHTKLINKRITLNLVGSKFSTVNSTSSGILSNVRNLSSGNYELSFYGDVYYIRTRQINVLSNFNGSIDLYGINISEGSPLDVIVRNRAYTAIQNISVELLRFYPDLNEWITIANGITDPSGLTRFYINFGGAKYKIILSYHGVVIYTSDGEYINKDTYRFTVDLYDYYVNWDDLQTSPLQVNVLSSPRTISFSWAEAAPSILAVGLRVWEDNITSYKIYSTQTSFNNAGTLSFSVPDNTKIYTAWTYINYTDGTIRYLDSASYAGVPATQEDFKEFGVLFAIILFFAVIGGTLYISRDPAVTVMACALLVFIISMMKLVILTKVELGIIIPGLMIAAYYLHKRGV